VASTGVDLIRERARELPDGPGVYLYRDASGEVLYVGKAKSLKKRVASYARADRALERRTADLVLRVASVEVLVTGSEVEALLLEQNLVKTHRPSFNVRLRDDKSYPYIAVTLRDRFPRVMFTRERHRRGVRYFGPYASASKVRETLDALNRVFPFRPCEGPEPGRRSGVPCLDHHIGRCGAPCVGLVTEMQYGLLIDQVVEFLEGKTAPVRRRLQQEMREAAAAQRYEDAARARNRLAAVAQLEERQLVDKASVGDVDVVGVAREGDLASIQLFPLRAGRLGERFAFTLENASGATLDDLVEAFVAERYESAGASVPPLIALEGELEDREALEALLTQRRGAHVEIRRPLRGEKRRLVALAQRNAELALRQELLAGERGRGRRLGALEELREALNLEVLPTRIECYDISNTMGSATMASLVVFEHGMPKKSDYRIFGIERDGVPDDFASMAEAISRRFARLASGVEDDASFAASPDLVVIDGGKGQLNAALAAMAQHDVERVAAIGLAKRLEEIYVPGRSAPVVLDQDHPGLLLLRRIRDEAHRFALSHHRRRRGREASASLFDALPGVGPARKRALLTHFRSPSAILAASSAELEAVPGLPARTARAIYAHLHKAG
jgi:excinuclease ABC subunit C